MHSLRVRGLPGPGWAGGRLRSGLGGVGSGAGSGAGGGPVFGAPSGVVAGRRASGVVLSTEWDRRFAQQGGDEELNQSQAETRSLAATRSGALLPALRFAAKLPFLPGRGFRLR